MKKDVGFLIVVVVFAFFASFVFYLDVQKDCGSFRCVMVYVSGDTSSKDISFQQKYELFDKSEDLSNVERFLNDVVSIIIDPFVESGDVRLAPDVPGVPTAPTGLTATVLSPTSVRLDWMDGLDEERLIVEVRDNSVEFPVWTVVFGASNLPPNTITYDVTGLTSGTSYTFRVIAENIYGQGISNEFSVTPMLAIPILTGINPSIIQNDILRTVTLQGSSLQQNFQINIGSIVYCNSFDSYCRWMSPTSIEFDVLAGAIPGLYNFNIQNADISQFPNIIYSLPSNDVSLTIQLPIPAPVLSSFSPSSTIQNNVPNNVQMLGSNFPDHFAILFKAQGWT